MRTFATKAWTNVTISIYAATAGNETWTRLDNVSVKKTPGAPTAGANCIEPGGVLPAAPPPPQVVQSPAPSTTVTPLGVAMTAAASTASIPADSVLLQNGGSAGGDIAPVISQNAWSWTRAIDLRNTADAQLHFQCGLVSACVMQISTDGVTWQVVAALYDADELTTVDIDLSAYAGRAIWIRFLFESGTK
jgi:hypothetical protein